MGPDQSRTPSESQSLLGEGSVERPLEAGERRRVAPFAAIAVAVAAVAMAALVAMILIGTRSPAGELIAAGLLVPP